jgi:type VI protein secretion system component VasK
MGLRSTIVSIQKKPESYRKRVLWLAVFFLMTIVVVIWVSSFKNYDFSDSGSVIKEIKKEIKDETSTQELEANMSSGIKTLQESGEPRTGDSWREGATKTKTLKLPLEDE